MSYLRVSVAEAELPFPAASTTASARIETLTSPSPVGVTSKVYSAPEPETFATVPFVTSTEAAAKPVTGSLNVAVTTIGAPDALKSAGVTVASSTVGFTVSSVQV